MASDEIVWQIIGHQHCSFKLKTTKAQTFCRNEYNATGLCTRQSCPLANSRYATIRSSPTTGRLYLFIKTIERSHMPNKWWEKIRLPANYAKAIESIDERLKYWPKFLIHKCKQRLTRLTQVAIRTKRLQKDDERLGERVVTKMAPKIRKREEVRERKAEAAAKIERAIERELIERLRSGAYGDKPLNVDERIFKKVLRGLEREGQGTRDEDLDEGIEEENEFEEELEDGEKDVEYVSDIEGDESDLESLEDVEDYLRSDEESGDEEDGSGSGSGSEDEASEDSGSSDDVDEEEDEKLKKALAGIKRKRGNAPKPPPQPVKKGRKGPKRQIEYEFENEPPLKEALLA